MLLSTLWMFSLHAEEAQPPQATEPSAESRAEAKVQAPYRVSVEFWHSLPSLFPEAPAVADRIWWHFPNQVSLGAEQIWFYSRFANLVQVKYRFPWHGSFVGVGLGKWGSINLGNLAETDELAMVNFGLSWTWGEVELFVEERYFVTYSSNDLPLVGLGYRF